MATAELRKASETEEWHLLLGQALLDSGKYPAALAAASNALTSDRWSVRIRWQVRQAFRGEWEDCLRSEGNAGCHYSHGQHQPQGFPGCLDLVVFAKAALVRGADPKRVLDSVLETARKAEPKSREVHLARGQLALDKHDYALAAKAFQEGLKELPEDPDLLFGSAQAFAPSDPELTQQAVEATLAVNSNHVGTLLLLVDHYIDAEDFKKAASPLDHAHAVNPATGGLGLSRRARAFAQPAGSRTRGSQHRPQVLDEQSTRGLVDRFETLAEIPVRRRGQASISGAHLRSGLFAREGATCPGLVASWKGGRRLEPGGRSPTRRRIRCDRKQSGHAQRRDTRLHNADKRPFHRADAPA